MYSVWLLVVLAGLVVWSGVLSYLLWQERQLLTQLFPRQQGEDIRAKFKEMLSTIDDLKKENTTLNRNLREVSKEGLKHTQRVALLRYNPYQDTGGDVSFSIALLDGVGNGLVLTSLHSRAGTRVYTKEVKLGKSQLQLSKEEQSVVESAMAD